MSEKIKRAFLDTEDGQIHYRIGGEGEALLLLHMNPRSSDEYRELMPLLTEKYRVIAMDLMGLGDSDKPPRMYTILDYAKTVIALLDELSIEKVNLLGNLTGAFVAEEVATSYPERVKKLILCNLLAFNEQGKAKFIRASDQPLQVEEDGSHLMKRWTARQKVADSAELNHRLVLDDLKCFGYPLYTVWAVANCCLDVQQKIQNIKCPTLIVWGMENLQQFERLGLALVKDRLLISQAIPQAKVTEFADGTICMMNQIPEKIADSVLDFLDEE
ncbi:MAG: alpha/beta hydrolase [Rivularia sp. (in: cyanobacteria)]